MLARQRQARIPDEVRRHGGALVGDLVALLGILPLGAALPGSST